MLTVEKDFARIILKDSSLVLSASIDDSTESGNAISSIGNIEFNLYRIKSGLHIMKAQIPEEKFVEYNLLQTPAEVIQAFLNLGKSKELSSYLKTIYRCEEVEEVTLNLPKKLLKIMKIQARTRNQDLQSYILSQLDESCLNLR